MQLRDLWAGDAVFRVASICLVIEVFSNLHLRVIIHFITLKCMLR